MSPDGVQNDSIRTLRGREKEREMLDLSSANTNVYISSELKERRADRLKFH